MTFALPEVTNYDATVYQIQITDPVQGYNPSNPDTAANQGISNQAALNLANRTNWLYTNLNLLIAGTTIPPTIAPLNSPNLTGTPTTPTPPLGDNSLKISNTAWVQSLVSGVLSLSVAGGTNVPLSAVQAGNGTFSFTGALTANIAVIVPSTPGKWTVENNTTGPYTLTVKTAAGTGVAVTQGKIQSVFGDGTNVYVQQSDFPSLALTGTPTSTTPAQFDASTNIATTAFVQRMGMQASGFTLEAATTTLGLGVIGGTVQISGNTAAITLTMPLTSAVESGSRVEFINSSNFSATIAPQGGTDHVYNINASVGPIVLKPGDCLILECQSAGIWIAVGGSSQLSFSSTLTSIFAAPPAIGSTTRNSANFTTLAANAGASVAGGLAVTGGTTTDTLSVTGVATGSTPAQFDNTAKLVTTAWANAIGPVVGSVRNLRMVVAAGATSATLTADEIIVETALGGAPYRVANVNQTINLATTGAGGMDTGTATANGFLGIYEITGPAVTPKLYGTMEGSVALPSVYSGATGLPPGYTASSLVAVVPISSTAGQFAAFSVQDRKHTFIEFTFINANTTSGVAGNSALTSTGVPKSALRMSGSISISNSAAMNSVWKFFADANSTGSQDFSVNTTSGGGNLFGYTSVPLSAPQTVRATAFVGGGSGTMSYILLASGYEI